MRPLDLDVARTALLVVDVQMGFHEIEARGVGRNNPQALSHIAGLLAVFRSCGGLVIHVRHASTEPNSVFRPERPGYAGMPEAAAIPGEPVVVKTVNAAFIGTDLEQRLRDAGIVTVVIAGATTNHCVETTARMAGNLGFDVQLVRDATWTYDRIGPDGEHHPAHAIHAMTLSNLNGEFARIVSSDDVIKSLPAPALWGVA